MWADEAIHAMKGRFTGFSCLTQAGGARFHASVWTEEAFESFVAEDIARCKWLCEQVAMRIRSVRLVGERFGQREVSFLPTPSNWIAVVAYYPAEGLVSSSIGC